MLAEIAPLLLCPTVAGRPPRLDAEGLPLVALGAQLVDGSH